MHIVALHAENFKRLKAIRIQPTGEVVEVVGRNAQGKSSVLDAVWAALGGEKASPDKPIREGATRAEVFVDLGDLRVTRRWTSNDRSTLLVESKDGLRQKSPQAVLDALVGKLSFDPLDFTRMQPAQQAQTLKTIAGLDLQVLEGQRQFAYEKRTAVNREMKKMDAQLSAMPPVNAPDEEVSFGELAAQHSSALKMIAANTDKKRLLRSAEASVEQLREKAKALAVELQNAEAEVERLTDETFGLADPDINVLSEQIQNIEKTNAEVRKKKERRAIETELRAKAEESKKLDLEIERCDESKRVALTEAKFPVKGLAVDGDTVVFNDQPFKQASTAEQIRVGLAIGAALNPKLRVILVREASALDADAMTEVARWAKENSMQVFLERVGDSTETGVLIEDGEVRG